jgi:hypothetical protein
MPKPVDYSNTIIYKITCKDPNIHDVYVGHTTNFVRRKYDHKHTCTNTTSDSYNCKLYEVIRNNGGWDNWKMEIVDLFNCKDLYGARKKEHKYFVSLKATLNTMEPVPSYFFRPNDLKPITLNVSEKKENGTTITNPRFYCKTCDFKCSKQSIFNKHLETVKHKRFSLPEICPQNDNEITITNPRFYCKTCDFKCSKQSIFNKHLETVKHDRLSHPENFPQNDNKYSCKYCMKSYKYHSGMCRHKKICTKMPSNDKKICNTKTANPTANNTNNVTHDVYDKLISLLEIIKNKNDSDSGLQNKKINTTNRNKEIIIFTGDNITINSNNDSHNNNNNNNHNNNHNNNDNNNHNNNHNNNDKEGCDRKGPDALKRL